MARNFPTVFDPSYRFSTSWIIAPFWLFLVRFLFSIYAFVTLFFILGWDGTHGDRDAGRNFSYFTTLTYWGLAFYNAVAALHTFTYWRTGKPLLARWPRWLQEMHSAFYSTIVIYPFIVTIVYWALLFSSFATPFATWSNVTQHALNSVYALFEIVIPRTEPLPWIHIPVIVVLLAMYLGLAYLTFYTQGFYVYDFLDDREHSRGIVAAYIIGILVGAIIIFIIVKYLILLRQWVTEVKLGFTGKMSLRDREKGGNKEGTRMAEIVDVGKAV